MGQKSKTYLVTGAAGFVGSRFIESAQERSISVIAVDETRYFSERREHPPLRPEQIVDRAKLMDWLENERPSLSAIVHLGARADTMEMDVSVFERMNVEYSKALWNYASRHQIPFVYASSAATYGNGEQGYDDDERKIPSLKPLNPYGESKQKFDLWALAEERKGNAPPTWAGFKFFNVYGFGEGHKGTMASVVLHSFNQIKKAGQVKLFKSHRPGIADGHQMRDFVFVEDVVDVLHFAINHPIRRGIYNLGSGKARTFLDLARAVFRSMGAPEKIEFIDTPEKIRDKYQYFTEAQMGRLREQGYVKAFTSLEEGVAKYVAKLGSQSRFRTSG